MMYMKFVVGNNRVWNLKDLKHGDKLTYLINWCLIFEIKMVGRQYCYFNIFNNLISVKAKDIEVI